MPLATGAMPKELAGYMAMFRSLFPRSETFKNACAYVVGLLSNLPRKNGETMAAAIGSVANKQAVHRFLATSPWLAEELDRLRVAHAVSVAATGTDGMLIVDEVSQLKQGSSSVGVKRQYLGCVGKTANGQVMVSVHYCDPRFDWPVTGRLYLPEEWTQDAARRVAVGVPEDVAFQTKGQIALELVRKALGWGVPADWVVMDAGYGELGVLRGLERMEMAFCVGVRKNFTVRIPEEIDALAASSEAAPTHRVEDIAAALPEAAWTAVTYRHGTDGPLTKRFAAVHVVAATKDETGPMVYASATTLARARSALRRGSSSTGMNDPCRSFGIRRCAVPAVVSQSRGRPPLRLFVRVSARSYRPAPIFCSTSTSMIA